MTDVPLSSAARLHRALPLMPWRERRVFMLAAVDGMDYPAIAERLVISEVEVEALLTAALIFLDRHLDDDG